MAHTVILHSKSQREFAHKLIDQAPDGSVVVVRGRKRTTEQNDKMWAMLTDISRQATLRGEKFPPDTWKLLAMRELGYEAEYLIDLRGKPFPIGMKSSRLNVQQMAELIEFIYALGAEHNVIWSEPEI